MENPNNNRNGLKIDNTKSIYPQIRAAIGGIRFLFRSKQQQEKQKPQEFMSLEAHLTSSHLGILL